MRHPVRDRLAGLALIAVLAMTACSKTEEGEPDVSTIRITAGTVTVNITKAGVVTGGPIVVTHGTSIAISGAFLKSDGTPETAIVDPTYRLDVSPAAGGLVTFTRTGAFAGTVNGITAGSTTVGVALFHVADNENHVGPISVPVN